MIEVHRLNGKSFYLNSDLIRTIEATPDTLLTLTCGDKLMVLEPADEVVKKTIEFRKKLSSEKTWKGE